MYVEQLQIAEEGGTQREEIDADGVTDAGETVEEIVDDLVAVDRHAIEVEANLNLEDDMDDDEDEDDDNMGS